MDSLQEDPNSEPESTMEMMRRNIMLESRMIDDLLDVNRIVRGKLTFQMEPVDLHAVISNAVETCRGEIEDKHIQTEIRLDAPEHFMQGDKSRLHQIVRNLVQNAVRYNLEGGKVEITTCNPDMGEVMLTCRDYGIGIDPDDISRIFRAFEQANRSFKAGHGGLGLGLAISKALVEAQRGTLTAHSEGRGKGSTFQVRFKTIPAPVGHVPAPAEPPRQTPHRRPLRILLVEDHDDTRTSLERLLRHFGYEVQGAQDAIDAHQKIEKQIFDILISDIGLPGQSGLELVQEIRKRRPIPAIALSGFGMDADVKQSRAAGFAEHLVKPIDFTKLREAVERQGSCISQNPD
jgi:CheY-like chemotaxis protein